MNYTFFSYNYLHIKKFKSKQIFLLEYKYFLYENLIKIGPHYRLHLLLNILTKFKILLTCPLNGEAAYLCQ